MAPYFSIWIHPVATFKELERRKVAGQDNYLNYLFIFATLAIYLPKINDLISQFDDYVLLGIVATFILAPVIGLFVFKYIVSYFLWKAGKILHGQATFSETQLIVAYALIPCLLHLIVALVFLLPALLSGNIGIILHQNQVTYLIISIFSVKTMIYGLSYFNKYNFGYAVLNIFILMLVLEAFTLLVKH